MEKAGQREAMTRPHAKGILKHLKRIALVFVSAPLLPIGLLILYEVFGMCVNHLATRRQTQQLMAELQTEVSDIEFIDIYSETGNTSGTGNHVDCLSSVTFSTLMPLAELEDRLYRHYSYNEWSCYLSQTEEGYYRFYLNTSAPFADNIEGH